MFRKSVFSLFVLAIMALMVVTVSAGDPGLEGCYVDTPTSVNEGAAFTVTVTCTNIASQVYGFEFGTALSGQAATAATSYTGGNFVTSAANGTIEGSNILTLYAVSRTGNDPETGNFTLGSYSVTADKGLTADGSATITLNDAGFKLSDMQGAVLSGLLQAVNDSTITIVDTPLSLLSGSVTLQSDGSVNAIANVDLTVGSTPFNDNTASATFVAVNVGNLEFTAATDGALTVSVLADMDSHLACTATSYTLIDGTNSAATQIGTITLNAGDVTSVSGDTVIDIDDATAIGLQFGSTTPTGEVDVNRDNTVDVFDLVHIGRNYGISQTTCS